MKQIIMPKAYIAKFVLAIVFLFGPFILFQLVPVSQLISTIVYWVAFILGVLLLFVAIKGIKPVYSSFSFPEISKLILVILVIFAFTIPVIAGLFLPFNYLIAFAVAVVSFIVLYAALMSWFDNLDAKSEILGAFTAAGFIIVFFTLFGLFAGDIM